MKKRISKATKDEVNLLNNRFAAHLLDMYHKITSMESVVNQIQQYHSQAVSEFNKVTSKLYKDLKDQEAKISELEVLLLRRSESSELEN